VGARNCNVPHDCDLGAVLYKRKQRRRQNLEEEKRFLLLRKIIGSSFLLLSTFHRLITDLFSLDFMKFKYLHKGNINLFTSNSRIHITSIS
jgi:hypothetical protein